MTIPQNAMDVDSDLSDISDELASGAAGRRPNPQHLNYNPQYQQNPQPYSSFPQQHPMYSQNQNFTRSPGPASYVPAAPSPSQMSSNGYRLAEQREYSTPVRGVSVGSSTGRQLSQQQMPISQPVQPPPPQKKSLFGFGRKKEDPLPLAQQSVVPPFQSQDMSRAQKRLSSENKRSSVEKRLSGMEKRLSSDPAGFASKRASLELKLHDGMIIVDEEDRNRLTRKNPAANLNKDNQNSNVPQSRMPTPLANANQKPSQINQPQAYDPRLQPSPQNQTQGTQQIRPPTNFTSPQVIQLNGSQNSSFQGPPRQGSLNNSTAINQRVSSQIPFAQQPFPQSMPGQQLSRPVQAPLNVARSSPLMMEQLQSQTWTNGSENPANFQFDPMMSSNSAPLGQKPPTIKEEDQFSDVDDDDDAPNDDSDEESAGSFLSFDDETEDNTEYNAVVDYELLDLIMGGSTDYDAPLPRASHSRKVVFNNLVKAQSFARVTKDGEVAPSFDPDTDTELEPGDGDEDEDEEDDESWDDSPPSPVMEVVSMLPLQTSDAPADIQPEIAPRGVSLKLNNSSSGLTGSVTPDDFQDQVSNAEQRPKTRHVQIQTRASIMRHEFVMTDLLSGDIDEAEFKNLSQQPDVNNAQITRMEEELQFLRSQNQAFQDTIAQLQADAATKQSVMDEATAKFERLSGQATKKIKELVADRKILEIEIEGLKGQVAGLEALVEKWTLEDS
ncbi:hypothetical protein HDU84_007631 [Entophlyctis sp. JEL0112]|nr:hypothetical protein HDU84_007631 [Entophlyctis sp. JEL0112]